MRFFAIHKLATYLLAISAAMALLLSPDFSPVLALIVFSAIGASWFFESPRFLHERFTLFWNIATVAFLCYQITEILRGGAVIIAGAQFLLLVLINKLFNRRSSRDYQQVYVLSFLLMVVATILNTNLTYAVCFGFFVVFLTWSLVFLHLRREMEENYLLKHADGAVSEKVEVARVLNSKRIVGLPFLAGTSLLSLGIIFFAVIIFALFPRIGFGLFFTHKRGGITMIGFSERVELGHHGVVRNNPQVVMRVFFPRGRPMHTLRWRGSAFDHYENGVWSHGPDLFGLTQTVAPQNDLYIINQTFGLPPNPSPSLIRKTLTPQSIYLEPLETTLIFAADRPVAVEVPKPAMGGRPFFIPRRGPLGEIRGDRMRTFGVRYFAYSQIGIPPLNVLRQSQPLTDRAWNRYLQLPHNIASSLKKFAQQVTRGHATIYDKALAIEHYLQSHYHYTLQLSHDPRLEPVEEFLFVTKRGHCEYFASAMALLLRSIGIHARQVNGFAGGEWNDIGKYLAVRQGDAHAWVEVLFSKAGWVTFDPTPRGAGPSSGGTGIASELNKLIDTLRMQWFRWVVEYDLGKQLTILKGVKRYISVKSQGDKWSFVSWRRIGILLALIMLSILAFTWYRRRSRAAAPEKRSRTKKKLLPATYLYQRLLHLLAQAGYEKEPGATPQEFVAFLSQRDFKPVLMVEKFTRWYYEARFGPDSQSEHKTKELDALLKELQLSIETEAKQCRTG